MAGDISRDRILSKLDEYWDRNDSEAARRHLLYWKAECESVGDIPTLLLISNELMGLYRKTGKREEALATVEQTMSLIQREGLSAQLGAATSYLNAATVCCAFDLAERGIALFERAEEIYLRELEEGDRRMGGLYNNMGLCLVALGRFEEARTVYRRALAVMERQSGGEAEAAITYLNMASACEAELGLLEADEQIQALLELAEAKLDAHPTRDGYYAFVCEKCATVFAYYGRFLYAGELWERAVRGRRGEA